MTDEEIKRVLDPVKSFREKIAYDIEAYDKLKRGDLGEIFNLHGIGQALISLRISRGLTQRDLANILGVNESQISRDERNEYHGITVERVSKILDALDVSFLSRFENTRKSA